MLRILYQDQDLVAVDKPAGFHVHPPEDERHRIPAHESCLHILRDQLGQYIYPVHRLDRPTSGVLLFALSRAAASHLAADFQAQAIAKTYVAVVRGWTRDFDTIDSPMTSDLDSGEKVPARTDYTRLASLELAIPHSRHPTSRYSLIQIRPHSGKRHQIRRHLARISHPLIGDIVHGDSEHNRIWERLMETRMLYLKAQSIEFTHPTDSRRLKIDSPWKGEWHRVFNHFGVCPR